MNFKKLTPLILAIVSNSAISSSQAPSITGSYIGEVQSAEEMSKASTFFTQNENGIISGSYVFIEKGDQIKGELTGCEIIESTNLKCIWKDKYGYGDLEVIFNGSFTKFYGAWNTFGSSKKYPWHGTKQ